MRGGYRRGKAVKPVVIAGTPSIYLLRDQFLTDYTAGHLDETISEPIVGIRRTTDAESKIFITLDRLRGGGQDTPVWGQSKLVWETTQYGGFARVTGRTLVGLLLPEDTIVTADIAFGWASADNIGDPRTDGLGFLTEDGGEQDIIVPGVKVKLRGDNQFNVRPMQYLIVITLNDVGAVWMISTFGTASSAVGQMTASTIPQYPLASIIWVDNYNTLTPLFPYIQYFGVLTYPNGNSLEDVRVLDVSAWSAPDALASFADHFTRPDSALVVGNGWTVDASGVWGISSGQAYFVTRILAQTHFVIHDTGLANGNGFFVWDWTCPTAGTPYFFLFWRYQDASNYWKIHNFAGNFVYITRVIAGVETDVIAQAFTWVAGQTYHITLLADGIRVAMAIDNAIKTNTSSAAWNFLTNATKFGFGESNLPKVGERWDNVAVYPLQTTLPAVFDLGKIPTILTGGTILAQDSFTGINGTNLTAHTPEIGPAWATDGSVWQITSNQADPVTPLIGQLNAFQELNTDDAEAQVVVAIPNPIPLNYILAGIVFRYVDVNNYCFARITHVDYAPTSDEVEMGYNNNGVLTILHKINLGSFNIAGTNRTIKVQTKDDLIQVFLNGEPIISYYTVPSNPTGTKWGLHVDRRTGEIQDEGALFNDWIARAL